MAEKQERGWFLRVDRSEADGMSADNEGLRQRINHVLVQVYSFVVSLGCFKYLKNKVLRAGSMSLQLRAHQPLIYVEFNPPSVL